MGSSAATNLVSGLARPPRSSARSLRATAPRTARPPRYLSGSGGNGFAGTTAAEQLRKHDPACEITLFADEPYTLYNRISLPPMLLKQIPEAKVMIRNLAWHEEHRITLHLRTHVERVVPEERVVMVDGTSYPYDALLIATGGRPNPTGKPGGDGAANLGPRGERDSLFRGARGRIEDGLAAAGCAGDADVVDEMGDLTHGLAS